MANKRFISLFVLATLLHSATCYGQKLWTLEACIDTALVYNLSIQQQQINADEQQIRLRQSKENRLPTLNGSVGQSFNFGRSISVDNTYQSTNSQHTSFGISSGLNLFDGLRTKRDIEIKIIALKSANADIDRIKKDIILNVSTVYLQALQNRELLKNTQQQIAITQQHIEQKKILVEAGKIPAGELYELEAQKAKEELAKVRAENALDISLLELVQVMQLPEQNEAIEISEPKDLLSKALNLLSPQAIYETAITQRPEIKIAQYNREIQHKNIAIAKATWLPTLSMSGSIGTGYYRMGNQPYNIPFDKQIEQNLSYGIGLNLNIPIFNRFEVKNRIRSNTLALKNSEIEIEKVKTTLKKNIQQAYHNAIAAKKQWEMAQKSVIAGKESYRFANEKYNAGQSTLYELNTTKTNLAQAISEQTQAKYEYAFRLKFLELMK